MLTSKTLQLIFTRNVRVKSWEPDAVRYGLIKYYPRKPDEKDPPITPTKVLLVEKVKGFKYQPSCLKKVLTLLGFDEEKKCKQMVVVKNTPEMCLMLWKVKHLVKISPIKLPEKLPDLNDLRGTTYLDDYGQFTIIPKVDQARCEAAEKHMNNPKRLDKDLIEDKIRLKWLSSGDIY